MNVIDAILTRKSIRKYTDKEISQKDLETILKAGQAGPTAVNKRDWQFLVVNDKTLLKKMAGFLGHIVCSPLLEAKLAIIVLGDANLSAGDFWEVDGSIAAQNMILAAHELGIGSCWIGVFPNKGRMNYHAKIFDLPSYALPHSIITFGYPSEEKDIDQFSELKKGKPLLEEKKVHYDKW
jgi:nitroreductase